MLAVRAGCNAPINLCVTWQLWDLISVLPGAVDNLTDSPVYRMIEEQARFLLGPLKGYAPDLNDFVTPQLAAHAYDYLGLLWLFTGMTILGALVPLYKYIPEEELLYPEYDFEEEPAPPPPAAPAGMGDAMQAPADMMSQGDEMLGGVTTDILSNNGGDDGDQQDYNFYDYQSSAEISSFQSDQNYDYQYGGGVPGQSNDYFDYQYGTRDLAGLKRRKDIDGYPPPHRLWQHTVGQQQSGQAPSRG